MRSRNLLVIAGALGYWALDNAVLWATFHAFDALAPDHRDPHGLPDRAARRAAAAPRAASAGSTAG